MSSRQAAATKRYDLAIPDLVELFGFNEGMWRLWASRYGLVHFQNGERGALMFNREDVEAFIQSRVRDSKTDSVPVQEAAASQPESTDARGVA